MAIIEFNNVNYSFHTAQKVLHNINFSVDQGDFLILLGPNGGGKSTLLKLIVGLYKPVSGTIKVFGGTPKSVLDRVGYLPQNTNVNPDFPITVLDVVLMGKIRKNLLQFLPSKSDKADAMRALEKVGMSGMADRRIGALSGGQRQRALIARALVSNPDLLLLDEPTASVDVAGKATLYELLLELNKSVTIVMVSHDISVIPNGVKSVACVNRGLHHHKEPKITPEMISMTYGTTEEGKCPVELIAHGIPHRVVEPHSKE